MPESVLLQARPRGGIKRLPADAVNRIAAGEVIERPAAAIKELIENALDAGALSIRVRIEQGGLRRLVVEDDGHGMAPGELSLAIERHATSKLAVDDDGRVDLLDIRTLGFRGEALPSIGSVSRMTIRSRAEGGDRAFELAVEGGRVEDPRPAPWQGLASQGTIVDVRDLYFATPARLKFMKSERSESLAVADTVRRLALSRPNVAFHLESDERTLVRLQGEAGDPVSARLRRLAAILGGEFRDNAIEIDAVRDNVCVVGFAGLPTFNRGSAQHQYLFVNGRPVKDRLMIGVIRAAYQDFLARDRHPMAALFLELRPEDVDVNVHPAKTEVRFRDPANVRGLMIGALRHGLAGAGHRSSTTVAGAALGAFRPGVSSLPWGNGGTVGSPALAPAVAGGGQGLRDEPGAFFQAFAGDHSGRVEPVDGGAEHGPVVAPLGAARAQLHETYIVAQTADGIVIVDQHAAHERLVYERMKAEMASSGVRRQALLIPEIVEVSEEEAERVLARAGELLDLGLEIEPFGRGALAVRATPALFGPMDAKGLIRDLADDFGDHDAGPLLKERMEEIVGAMACRGSVRAGRRLSGDEMNALLRQMEATPHSGQCNHGRPTYVELKLSDIERLFGRR